MFKFLFAEPKKKFSHSHSLDDVLEKTYHELVVKHHIHSDAGQIKVLGHLQQLLNDISSPDYFEQAFAFRQLISSSNKKPAESLYIFGDIGHGKSMLMDVFFKACPIKLKRRVHFHAFMQEVHDFIHQWRKTSVGDPVPSLAENIKQSAVLLCLDEFHVSDIADAMLLSRLFTHLFKLGVVFVFTSNQHPDALYKNGLQRELFLPFIDLLKRSSEILELEGKEDYRLSYFKAMKTTFYLDTDGSGDEFLQQRFNELTNMGTVDVKILKVKGRELRFDRVHGDILFSSFERLCGSALGAADYLAIASEFNTILITGIPQLSVEIRDKVRRFVTLIDALYEANVKLICTAAVPIEALVLEDNNFNFKRTRSRLIEMQSEAYFKRAHLTE